MKNLVLLFLIFLFLASGLSAITINEIESNPAGTDVGNEWVEFYSNEEVNLEGYKIINNDGDEIILNGSFSGYYVYTFEKQWLDNSDEKIVLYKEGELIDKTDIFEDNENNDKTWQLCDNWELVLSTKESENSCEAEPEETTLEEIINKSEENLNVTELIEEPIKTEPEKEIQVIKLNTKNIKTQKNEEEEEKNFFSKGNYATYGFVFFCVLLGVLFFIRKRKLNKNEFE